MENSKLNEKKKSLIDAAVDVISDQNKTEGEIGWGQSNLLVESQWLQGAVHKSREGMFDGWTLDDLESALSKLENNEHKTHDSVVRERQLEFAIRAKKGHGFHESFDELWDLNEPLNEAELKVLITEGEFGKMIHQITTEHGWEKNKNGRYAHKTHPGELEIDKDGNFTHHNHGGSSHIGGSGFRLMDWLDQMEKYDLKKSDAKIHHPNSKPSSQKKKK
jgi:hypothetical protein